MTPRDEESHHLGRRFSIASSTASLINSGSIPVRSLRITSAWIFSASTPKNERPDRPTSLSVGPAGGG
jgi:hypothetical protein